MTLTKVSLARVAALALACAFTGAGPSAQTGRAPTQLPPLPLNEKGFPRALAPVVGAEHAFAQHAIDHGMKPAFLAYAAPDGVIFRRTGPVNAIEAWAQRNPAPTGLLTWWPTYADVSRAGDLGWTTGPYEFREKPSDARPAGTGHFFTVWRRQPDGSWKFVLDLGIEHPAPAAAETALVYPAEAKKGRAGAAVDAEAARGSLLDAERALSEASSTGGFRSALVPRADESVRVYRQGSFPVVGRRAFAGAIGEAGDYTTWKPLKADVSASGDLGYAYGTYELRSKPGDAQPAERGNYARVWKRQTGGPWRVVFNVSNPTP
jgi:ketosteroid isomerase-like protein